MEHLSASRQGKAKFLHRYWETGSIERQPDSERPSYGTLQSTLTVVAALRALHASRDRAQLYHLYYKISGVCVYMCVGRM